MKTEKLIKTENEFYAVEVILLNGEKLLCWQDKKHFYFAKKNKKFQLPYPPKLFRTRKEAVEALKNIPIKGGNIKQFTNIIEYKNFKIVKVQLTTKNK